MRRAVERFYKLTSGVIAPEYGKVAATAMWRNGAGSPTIGQCAATNSEAAPEKGVIFNYLSLSNLAVRYGLKMIGNSTCIVGIYCPAVKAGYIPPRCGAVVLSKP